MSYELNDGLTMCGYTGFGNTYATPGAKQDTRTVTGLHARFVELDHAAEAQISVSVSIDYPSGQSRTLHGGLQLTPEQAAKLAAAIAPPSSVTKARCDALSAVIYRIQDTCAGQTADLLDMIDNEVRAAASILTPRAEVPQ